MVFFMKKRTLTSTEKKLLQGLTESPNATLAEIAREYNIPIGSIYRLYKNLFKLGYIKTRLYVLDYSKIGFNDIFCFVIDFDSQPLFASAFYSKCSEYPFVEEVLQTEENKIILKCVFRDNSEKEAFIRMLQKDGISKDRIHEFKIKRKYMKQIQIQREIKEQEESELFEGFFPR